MSDCVVELEGITVRKANSVLLDNVTLKVIRNEFVGIIGPNGAGKTTLLDIIAGFERFEGSLKLFGRAESWKRSRETVLRIGYLPQHFQVDPSFPISVSEAVMTGVTGRVGLLRSPDRHEKEMMMKVLDMMRIAHLADRPLGHLSGGERQKVSLARAILQRPDVLLLDEPTANLDIAVQKEFMNLVTRIHKQGSITILLVTHDFTILPAAMERALLLSRGKTVFDGCIHEAMSSEALSRLFQYPLETFERNGKRFVSYD